MSKTPYAPNIVKKNRDIKNNAFCAGTSSETLLKTLY